MITEMLISSAIVYGIKYITSASSRKISNQFNEIVHETKLNNKSGEGYKLNNIRKTDYGFSALVNIPKGLEIKKLEDIKRTIETNMKCLVEIEQDKFQDFAYIKIITNPLNNLKYEVVSTKPYEMFLGYKYDGKPYKLNMNDDTHLLIGGVRGSGKSRLESLALCTLLKNHSEKQIEVYLMELMKKDLKKFKNCKQVKMFVDTLQDTSIMLKRIEYLLEKRSETIETLDAENIYEYNQKAKIKMKYIWIFGDEYSLYMSEDDDTEEEKEYKASILSSIKKISKLGRSCGVFFVSGLQRSTIDNINSTVKSQMCRLSFAQLSELDSNNIIGIPDAKGLKKQECILFTGNQYVYLKTPYIDNEIINDTLGIKKDVVKDNSPTRDKQVYNAVLSYEESEKLKAHSEFYIIEDNKSKTIIEEVKESQKEKKTRTPRKRKGVKKDIKEVATNNEGNGKEYPDMD